MLGRWGCHSNMWNMGGRYFSQQIMDSSKTMEQLHAKLNDMITTNVEEDQRYVKLTEVAENQIKWRERAKA